MTSWSIKNLGFLFAASLLFVTGCGSFQQPAAAVPLTPTQSASAKGLLDGSIRYDTENQRVAELWSAAEDARRRNDDSAALNLLYEALDLSPENSLLWSRAAELQLDNDQALLAEDLALKSNAFAGENPVIMHRNWLIIEHARSLRGDLLGVRSARKRVQEFQYQ